MLYIGALPLCHTKGMFSSLVILFLIKEISIGSNSFHINQIKFMGTFSVCVYKFWTNRILSGSSFKYLILLATIYCLLEFLLANKMISLLDLLDH